jgi:APA family basic amino acid/polyamine antiporter
VDLLRTKPVEDILAQNGSGEGEAGRVGGLRKRLGPWDLIGFGVGIVIGTGIFTLTGVEARDHAGARSSSRSCSPE